MSVINNRKEFQVLQNTGPLVKRGNLVDSNLKLGCQYNSLQQAMEHFNVSVEDIEKVMKVALEKGADYADLFFEHSFKNNISLQDGEVNRCNSNIEYGVGVRVVSKDQTGYAYVENINLKEMLNAAKTAARIAQESKIIAPISLDLPAMKTDFYAVDTPWESILLKDKIPYLQRLNKLIFDQDHRVIKVMASLSDTTSHILFFNSDGVSYYDYRPMVALAAVCVMQDGSRIENGYASRSYRRGFEFLTDELVSLLAHEVITNTSISFQAIKPKGGEMPVVMAAGGSGILLHEAIGHAFEADFNRKNTSIFSDQLHKQICNKEISVIDDGTIPYNRGSVNIDDEGVDGQKTYLVREGVLTSYLHDRISSKHYGVEPTGNGRRESFRCIPIPRMRATYMESGGYEEKEIISSVKRGVYVNQFTNGQVQIGAGDFTFFVKLGYLIENGQLTQPIKDINIIGNGPKALSDIEMVGNNAQIDNGTWTCGKDGQSCPVTCGMPSVLVRKLTVGGDS